MSKTFLRRIEYWLRDLAEGINRVADLISPSFDVQYDDPRLLEEGRKAQKARYDETPEQRSEKMAERLS